MPVYGNPRTFFATSTELAPQQRKAYLKSALHNPTCQCQCGLEILECDLYAFARHWHHMCADAKATMLQAVTQSDKGEPQGAMRTQWHFLGHALCVPCLMQLLRMTQRTFYKRLHGTFDGRVQRCKQLGMSRRDLSVDQFFAELYFSAGETLPEHDGLVNAALPESAGGRG